MSRPRIDAAVAAALTAQVLPRLIRKLDASPELAASWTWTDTTVTTDRGETVTLAITDGVVRGVTCSCLLAPKCLHVAAVVAALEPAEPRTLAPPPGAPGTPPSGPTRHAASAAIAGEAFRVIANVLATGAETTGAFAQAELLRSIHACRAAGLHRLATVQTRVLRSVRDLRADRPEFDLEVLTADLRDALDVAHAIEHGAATDEVIGAARREYAPVGSLRLHGLFTEAVVARSGYAGAITYFVDDRGRLFTRADVAPGDAGRAAGAYDAPAAIGDAVLPHRELGRAGLFVAEATASVDGRLGAGAKVRAVRASEPSRWDAVAGRWDVSLAEQLARVAAHDATPEATRPAGWDLMFVDGAIVPGGLLALDDGTLVTLTTAHDQRVLAARDNLAVLARAPGLQIRAIARVQLGAPRQLELLAIAPRSGETRLVLAPAWQGRANLHYDRLSRPAIDDLRGATLAPAPMAGPADELLAPLRRRVERVVQGGAGTLPVHAIAELEREASVLGARALRGAAAAMRDLAALAYEAGRANETRPAIDRTSFARAWLRAALYEDAARRRLGLASW